MEESFTIQECYSYVYYLLRDRLWRTTINMCKNFEKRFGDSFFTFWKAYAIFREGNPSQAVTEIQKIESKKDLQWATIRAAIHYHKKCKHIDKGTVDSLISMEKDFQRNPTERAAVTAIYFELMNEDLEKAGEIAKKTHFDSPMMMVAKGWCELISLDDTECVTVI